MYIFEKTDNDMCGVYIVFQSPAMNEDKKTYGISHLLEHMICEATDDIDETYDENCIYTNAYTGKEEVVFYMTGLSDRVAQFRDDYIKRILTYVPTEKDFNKQKPIITQEYNDWFTNTFKSTYVNFLSKQFGFVNSVGTREAIDGFTYEDAVAYKNKYFSKPSKIIIADNVDNPVVYDYEDNIPSVIQNDIVINKDAEINELSIGYIAGSTPIPEGNDDFNLRMIVKMLGYGLKSPLYQRLREQSNLCYWVSSFDQYLSNKNILLVGTSATAENKTRIHDELFEVLNNPTKYLTEDRFNLMLNNTKASLKVKSQYKHELDYLSVYLDKDSISLRKNLDKINYADVMNYYMTKVQPSVNNWTFTDQKELYN